MGFRSVTKDINLSVATFTCHRLKSSADYVIQLSKQYQITFVCEHWLLPKDISMKDTLKAIGKTAYLHSSIDNLASNSGRPYGGIGFLCVPNDGITQI